MTVLNAIDCQEFESGAGTGTEKQLKCQEEMASIQKPFLLGFWTSFQGQHLRWITSLSFSADVHAALCSIKTSNSGAQLQPKPYPCGMLQCRLRP